MGVAVPGASKAKVSHPDVTTCRQCFPLLLAVCFRPPSCQFGLPSRGYLHASCMELVLFCCDEVAD